MPGVAGMTVIGSNEYLADPFGDHRGLVFALDLVGKFGGLLPLAGALFIEREQREAAAHALARADGLAEAHPRSEEHTSELQSLMRISYAVFCLKTKTNTHIIDLQVKV